MPLRQPEWREGPAGQMQYYELGFKRLGWVDPRWPGGVGALAVRVDTGVAEFRTVEEAKRYVEVTCALIDTFPTHEEAKHYAETYTELSADD